MGLKKINFLKLKPVLKHRGDTILEVVIATAILSSIMIATFNILQRAIDTNLNVKNRVIALNIAREGLEAVRNVRDTNWLKYSGERRSKWLCLDQKLASPSDDPTCTGSVANTDIINENVANDEIFYTIDFDDDDDRYYLKLGPASLQTYIDFETTQNNREDYRLYLTSGPPKRYTHTAGGNETTPFYRQIKLTIYNPYQTDNAAVTAAIPSECGGTDTDESCVKARLNVESRVFWQEDGRSRSVGLETNLFDFFERDAY